MEVAEVGCPTWDGDAGGGGAGEEGRGELLVRLGEWEARGAMVEGEVRMAGVDRRGFRIRYRCGGVGSIGWMVRSCFDRAADCRFFPTLLVLVPVVGRIIIIIIVLVEFRQWVRNVLQLHHGTFLPKIKRMHVYGADKAREGDLLEFVVDEIPDGIGKGDTGGTGCQGGPVDCDGHLHDGHFSCFSFLFLSLLFCHFFPFLVV